MIVLLTLSYLVEKSDSNVEISVQIEFIVDHGFGSKNRRSLSRNAKLTTTKFQKCRQVIDQLI